jgi:RNA polymerase sigma-70 factor (ECF subfamily)
MDPDELPDGGVETGAAEALKRLFELHSVELYRFAYRYVRSAEVAKDLVHEAYLRLWRQRDRVDLAGPTARSYLHTIVRYQALDHLRRRRIEDRWRQEYLAPVMVARGPLVGGGDPEQDLAAKEIAQAIGRAIQTLPQRQQQVLMLRWQHQASYDDIAMALGISPKTVGVHFTRGIQRLRELLAKIRY